MWSRVLKLDPIYGETAWKAVSVTGLLKKWTSHSAAADFTAPKPDNGLVPLHFQDNKELEYHTISYNVQHFITLSYSVLQHRTMSYNVALLCPSGFKIEMHSLTHQTN